MNLNWKIILQLSLFGLIMAFGTVSLIPQSVEPFFWLAIFVFCAYVIAKVCTGKYFLHGFLVSLVNCVWIIAVHIIFAKTYVEHHLQMATSMPGSLAQHPRLAMLITGPVVGVISGLLLGLFSWIAARFVKNKAVGV